MPIGANHQNMKLAVALFNNVDSSIDEQFIRYWPFSTKAIQNLDCLVLKVEMLLKRGKIPDKGKLGVNPL